jgi:hypothetical protein
VIGGAGGSFSGGVSSGGNTDGTTGTVGNGLLFFGGTNITLSQSSGIGGATITINAPPTVLPPAAFEAGISTGGNTLGDTGTVTNQIIFAGGSNITLSGGTGPGGETVTIIGPANQTGISGIAGSGASTVTAGTIQFANSNGVSFGLNGSTMTASLDAITSQSIQTQGSVAINGSTGAISFAAGNLMSLSTAGSTLTYINVLSSSAIAQNVSNVSSAGTLASRFALADHAHVGLAGVNASGTASTFVGNLMLSGTNLTLVTGGNATAGSIGFSVAAQTAQTGISGIAGSGASTVTAGTVQFANSNNMTFGLNGSTMTASFSVTNTIPSIGTTVNPVASIASTGTAARYAPDDHQHAGVFSIGISAGVGNTSGTTAVLPGRMVFAGGNNITLSQSTSAGNLMTITISHSQPAQTGISGIAGSAASTVTAGTIQFANSNGVSFGLNGSTMTASYTQSTPPIISKYYHAPEGAISSAQQSNNVVHMQFVEIPYDLSFTRVDIPILVSLASSGTTNTAAIVMTSGLFIYSMSASQTLNPITGSVGTTTYTWASNTANFNNLTGGRLASFALATTLPAGQYYVGFQLSTTSGSSIGASTTALGNTVSLLLGSCYTASAIADLGAATNVSSDMLIGRAFFNGGSIAGTSQSVNLGAWTATGVGKFYGNFPVLFRNF